MAWRALITSRSFRTTPGKHWNILGGANIAIPTSAGTGAEVTRNAVLASPEHQVEVRLRSPLR